MSSVVYWVVGGGTNVGKTTIASAVIKLLTAQGQRSVGFKPFAGGLLADLIDFMIEKYPTTACKLYGMDAWTLATSSPLTDAAWLDIVAPVQLICHPNWQSAVLLRSGSIALGNVEYYCSDLGAELRERADLKWLAARSGLPLAEASTRKEIGIGYSSGLTPEKPLLAFERLLELEPDAVVCEGAGNWLPVWQDCPVVNHAFHLSEGMVRLFPNVDLTFEFNPEGSLPEEEALTRRLGEMNAWGCALPLYLVEEKDHEAMALNTVSRLLTEAGLLPGAGE